MAAQAPAQSDSNPDALAVTRTVCARVPTAEGVFQLCHFSNTRDFKEHMALVYGDVTDGVAVPVRVHSECFTGDVLGSRRCDCGEQLHRAMAYIVQAGRGVIIYLRQEGRGIGLEQKLRAYNLQDEGYDTVEANLLLGHQADERDYWAAAAILRDLRIHSVQLLTNNPAKIEHLRALGVAVERRIPVIAAVHTDNRAYLETKVQRMRHLLAVRADQTEAIAGEPGELGLPVAANAHAPGSNGAAPLASLPDSAAAHLAALKARIAQHSGDRAFVTLTYAQSLNGAIGGPGGTGVRISGPDSMRLTHLLRTLHTAILVGVGTILADNPRLTARLATGPSPRPVILDSQLRTPPSARIFTNPHPPLIATCLPASDVRAQALAASGARILTLPAAADGRVDLRALLAALPEHGLHSVMVEGGAQVIAACLAQRLVDALVVTVAPNLLAGIPALPAAPVAADAQPLPRLAQTAWSPLGDDLILWAQLDQAA